MKQLFGKIFLPLLMFYTIFFNISADNNKLDIEELLSDPQGIAELVPGFKGDDGKFQVPDPTKNLDKFLQAYHGIRNLIDAAIIQKISKMSPAEVGSMKYNRLSLDEDWVSSEVGYIDKDGSIPNFSKGGYGYYGEASFLQGIVEVKGTGGTLYTIPKQGTFISMMPTVLKNINIAMETSADNGGTFISPSYVIGTKDGKAFMLVNGCQNTATVISVNDKKVLSPEAKGFMGIQVAKKFFR